MRGSGAAGGGGSRRAVRPPGTSPSCRRDCMYYKYCSNAWLPAVLHQDGPQRVPLVPAHQLFVAFYITELSIKTKYCSGYDPASVCYSP